MSATGEERLFEVFITAEEAYPALERQFLAAESEIIAGFRVFDPWTTLVSDEAKAIGTCWFDLIVDTLRRGVRINITITDFDPVARMEMHLASWRSVRALHAAGEASGQGANLKARTAMHPARVGFLPRLALWPRSVSEVNAQLLKLKENVHANADRLSRTAPGLRLLTTMKGKEMTARWYPPPPLVPVTHHQKLAVFDRERLYIGGLDLDDRRYDTPAHDRPGEETWHDVQVLVTGPVVEEARQHLLTLDDALVGKSVPKPKKLLRTISTKRQFRLPFMSPRNNVDEIAQAHRDAIDRSEELVFFETQFFRDEPLARHLAARAAAQDKLTLIMMLPAAPEEIAFSDDWGPDAAFGEHLQTKCVDIILDAFGDRAFIGSPVKPVSLETSGRDTHWGSPIIYLHAKVSIFDDHSAIVSSANLNGRSLSWDTEAGIWVETRQEVAKLKQRCFDHWLGAGSGPDFFDTKTALRAWTARGYENAMSEPEQRKGFVVPYNTEAARSDAQALPGVPPEMA